MKTVYTIIQPTGPEVETSVDWPNDPGYDLIKRLVLPILKFRRKEANLEHVSVLYQGQRADMFVDDMSAIEGLPPNPRATAIYHAASKAAGISTGNASQIYGTAIVFHRKVWF